MEPTINLLDDALGAPRSIQTQCPYCRDWKEVTGFHDCHAAQQAKAHIDDVIASIKRNQDEFIRGGREILSTPEEDERRKYKQIRLSRTYMQ